MNTRKIYFICIALIFVQLSLNAQDMMEVEGNGLFVTPTSSNIDIKSTDDNTNASARFGDNNTSKFSAGFNGNEDAFKISSSATLGGSDLTVSSLGRLGVNTIPETHRMLIFHNSTSGISGSAHLTLKQNNNSELARLRFDNLGDNNMFNINARASEGTALMQISHNDGFNSADILTLDGDQFKVGVHQAAPEGYLHVHQLNAGVDAISIENDNAGGSDTWEMRVGDEDILIYYNGGIRGGFDVSTGNYNNFPPSPAQRIPLPSISGKIDQILQINPVRTGGNKRAISLVTIDLETLSQINPDFCTYTSDGRNTGINYSQLTVLTIQAIQERQIQIAQNQDRIHSLKEKTLKNMERIEALESQLNNY